MKATSIVSYFVIKQDRLCGQGIDRAPHMLAGSVRVPLRSHWRLEKQYLRPIQPCAR